VKPLENVGKTSVLLHPSHVIGTPPKKMGQHTRQHMVMPSRIFAQFIVGHT
jgi:hypothetical protein